MVSGHTSDGLVLFERADCVSRSTYWRCGSGQSSRSGVLAHWFRMPFTQGGITQHGHRACPSVSLRVRPHLASRKFYFFFPLWFCLDRTWRTNLPKGACALLLTSVDHDRAPVVGVRVNVLLSRYLIEPCGSGKSKLTYMCRADLRYVLVLVFFFFLTW